MSDSITPRDDMATEQAPSDISIKLFMDQLCDEAERQFRVCGQVAWESLFSQLKPIHWPMFVGFLIPQLKQITGLAREQELIPIFSNCGPRIRQVISDLLDKTTSDHPVTQRAFIDDPSGVNLALPEAIEHFSIKGLIGQGGFGQVLLARDTHLNRDVVIKLPREDAFGRVGSLDAFVEEARKVAMLDHPKIVRIYHVGMWHDQPFLVQQYVSGGDLKKALLTRRFTFTETANIVAQVAEGIAYAHQLRIVHRDLKPANILLDAAGNPLVADFGLAIHESEQLAATGKVVGTLQYMAPEQVRGETHRLDGRTDLWSLGICMYRMLVGELPFQGSDSADLRQQICQQAPRPLRQLNAEVPLELERICLKCLSPRMSDRYGTGVDLALDLREWLTGDGASETWPIARVASQDHATKESFRISAIELADDSSSANIVPKGLFAFDQGDQHFFLNLLPGPRTREGIPEQIRYWIDRIVVRYEGLQGLQVGLIYGPSGCGKSSFVQAGLLPLLPQNIITVYVEATDTDTEVRLLVGLRKHFPNIPRDHDLPQILSQLRSGQWLEPGKKVLLVLDQFEQWLHANEITMNNQLIEGLRHCDGDSLQAIILARDDFWMKVSRFFQELEIPLSERENYHPIYLFDKVHAKKVLTLFGRAYGRLPHDQMLSADQERFLDEAVTRLLDRDKIICIHLVLLVETLKLKTWSVDSLKRIGQLKHIGTLFLEQHLSDQRVNPAIRFHREAISQILRALLPDQGTDIKARFRERAQLAEASGFSETSAHFQTVMDILEKQLRLIAAAEPDASSRAAVPDHGDSRYYQLTHDFLVPSVREWFEKIQRVTASGRAKLRLEVLSESYQASSDPRYLPTFLEFLAIARWVRPRECAPAERMLYWKSVRTHCTRVGIVGLMLFIGTVGLLWYQTNNRSQLAVARVDQWVVATNDQLSIAAEFLRLDPAATLGALRTREQNDLQEEQQFRIDLAFVLLGETTPARMNRLISHASQAETATLASVRPALAQEREVAIPLVNSRFTQISAPDEKTKLALMLFHLGEFQQLLGLLDATNDRYHSLIAVHLIGDDLDSLDDYLQFLAAKASETTEHDLLSGMVKGVGRRDFGDVDAKLQRKWSDLCNSFYRDSPSGPMHSAAEYALRNLGQTIPRLDNEDTKLPQDRNWLATLQGLTLVRIPASGKVLGKEMFGAQLSSIDFQDMPLEDYWMSTTEVPNGLFAQFASDPACSKYFEKAWRVDDVDTEYPATSIRVTEAMAFCNWLSLKEGLEPFYIDNEQPYKLQEADLEIFDTKEAEEYWGKFNSWSVNSQSSGYRLPNYGELAFAPYGESLPNFPDSRWATSIMNHLAWYSENAQQSGPAPSLQRCGTRMPNAFGLFDIVGNAGETAIDTLATMVRVEQLASTSNYGATLQGVISINYSPIYFANADANRGIRVARSNLMAESK